MKYCCLTFLLVALSASFVIKPASAQSTFTVTSLADDGGAGELRAAINSANASPGSTIIFQSGLSGTITLTSGLPTITTGMTITGPGASTLAISGAGTYQPVNINNPATPVTITGLTIEDGNAGSYDMGGGVEVIGGGTIYLTGCSVTGNYAAVAGGGLYNSHGTVTLTNCTISQNFGGGGGGGICNDDYEEVGSIILINCKLSGNTAEEGGAIINVSYHGPISTVSLTNCALSENGASGPGGGIYNSASATLMNCTLSDNGAGSGGGGIYNDTIGTASVTNCILYGDSAVSGSEIVDVPSGLSATYSDIQGGYPGTANISANPMLANAPIDLHLEPGSACYKAGAAAGAPSTTLDGVTRPSPPSMGAYELLVGSAVTSNFVVTSLADDGGSGELRWAINSANAIPGSTITFQSGLKGTITLTSGLPQITAGMTITGPGSSEIAVDGATLYRPFYINSSFAPVTISGLTVQHGSDQVDNAGGAGIDVQSGNFTLSNCVVSGNVAAGYGGGINIGVDYNSFSTFAARVTLTNCTVSGNNSGGGAGVNSVGVVTLTGCTLSGNSTPGNGGGFESDYGSALLTNCVLSGNHASTGVGGGMENDGTATLMGCTVTGNSAAGGGGVYNDDYQTSTTLTMTDCTLSQNTASGSVNEGGVPEDGGGVSNGAIYGHPALIALTNCVLTGNSAEAFGGGVYNSGSAGLINCTFMGNSAGSNGGGTYNDGSGSESITNNILYGDLPAGSEVVDVANALTAVFSDVQGGYTGTGNINASPMFVSSTDLHLEPTSPCYEKGTATGAPTTTLDGYLRPTPPSMGAYELEPGLGLTAVSGNSQIELTWSAYPGATSYDVYRSTVKAGEKDYANGITETSYADTSVTIGSTYYYRVVAIDSAGQTWSGEVSATAVAGPVVPTGLSATGGAFQIGLTWSASVGSTSYNVYRSTTAGAEGTPPIATGVPATAFTNTGLVGGVTYYYKVAGVSAAGTSVLSAEAHALTIPSAPVVTAAPGNSRVTITFSASTGATSYNLYESTTSGGEGTVPFVTGVKSGYINSGLTDGVTYYYTVAAIDATGTSAQSSEAAATPVAPPPSATGLTAGAGSGRVTLSWTAATGATSYDIERSTVHAGELDYVNGVSGPTFSDTGVTNGVTYYYRIVAVNAGGMGGWTSEVLATPIAAPTGLNATGGVGQVALFWTASTGAKTYQIFRATASGAEGTTAIASGLTTTSYTNTGLTGGANYYYTVVAVNTSGTSSPSTEVHCLTIPTVPVGVTAAPTDARIKITFTASPGATGYALYRSTTSGAEGTTPYVTGVGNAGYTDTGVSNGTTYFYTVAAIDSSGTSGQSAEVSGTPASPPPAATGLTATGSSGQVALSWTPAAGATSYNLMRATVKAGEVLYQSGVTGTSYVDTGVTNGTTYYYRLVSVNVGGTGGWTGEVSATP